RPFDGLTNPPSRIGGESEAPLWIKLLYCSNQAKVSFFDQVQQGQAPVDITTCNLDDQAQVAFNHALTASFVPFTGQTSVINFLFRSQKRRKTNFIQIDLGSIQLAVALPLAQHETATTRGVHPRDVTDILVFYVIRKVTIFGKDIFLFKCQRSEEHTSELQSRENLVCR